jgi:hypothetical protein
VHTLNQRLAAEWQDLAITYPLWLSTLVLDDVYYAITLVAMSLVSFGMGLVIVMTVV